MSRVAVTFEPTDVYSSLSDNELQHQLDVWCDTLEEYADAITNEEDLFDVIEPYVLVDLAAFFRDARLS